MIRFLHTVPSKERSIAFGSDSKYIYIKLKIVFILKKLWKLVSANELKKKKILRIA